MDAVMVGTRGKVIERKRHGRWNDLAVGYGYPVADGSARSNSRYLNGRAEKLGLPNRYEGRLVDGKEYVVRTH